MLHFILQVSKTVCRIRRFPFPFPVLLYPFLSPGFLLSPASPLPVVHSSPESLCFFDGKFIRVSGNERVPATTFALKKITMSSCLPNIFFVQNFSDSTFPYLLKP